MKDTARVGILLTISLLVLLAGCSSNPASDALDSNEEDVIGEGEGEGAGEGEGEGEGEGDPAIDTEMDTELETVEETGNSTEATSNDTVDTGEPDSCAYSCRSSNYCDANGIEHSEMNPFCDQGRVCCEVDVPTDSGTGWPQDTGSVPPHDTGSTPSQDTATYDGPCQYNCMRKSSCDNLDGIVHEEQYCSQNNRVCCDADLPTDSATGWPQDTGSAPPQDTGSATTPCEFTCMSGWQCNQQEGTRHDDQYCDNPQQRCCELP